MREMVVWWPSNSVGPFEPEYVGKMDFYLNLLNDLERGPGDQMSIGIILCAEKEDVEVEKDVAFSFCRFQKNKTSAGSTVAPKCRCRVRGDRSNFQPWYVVLSGNAQVQVGILVERSGWRKGEKDFVGHGRERDCKGRRKSFSGGGLLDGEGFLSANLVGLSVFRSVFMSSGAGGGRKGKELMATDGKDRR